MHGSIVSADQCGPAAAAQTPPQEPDARHPFELAPPPRHSLRSVRARSVHVRRGRRPRRCTRPRRPPRPGTPARARKRRARSRPDRRGRGGPSLARPRRHLARRRAPARDAERQRDGLRGEPAEDRNPARRIRRGRTRAPPARRRASRRDHEDDPLLEQRGCDARSRLGGPGAPARHPAVAGDRALRCEAQRRSLGGQELRPRKRVPARPASPPLARRDGLPGRALLLAARQRPARQPASSAR